MNDIPHLESTGQIMVIAAHRYCLGRRSYIVGICIDWLNANWSKFEDNTKFVILRDTICALQDNNAGDSHDYNAWQLFASALFKQLSDVDKDRLRTSIAYKNKPWPLTSS